MRRFLTVLCLCVPVWAAAGCAAQAGLTEAESAFLEDVLSDILDLKPAFKELEGLSRERVETGPVFVSYSHDPTEGQRVILFNPDYFWFKVSLSKNPVDAFDSHPPVLTMHVPRLEKYLKLRVVSGSRALAAALLKTVYQKGLEYGGEDPRIGR